MMQNHDDTVTSDQLLLGTAKTPSTDAPGSATPASTTTNTTATSITVPDDQQSQPSHPDTYYLEYMVRTFLDAINSRSFDNAESASEYMAPEFTGQYMYEAPDESWPAHLARFRRMAQRFPNMQIHIIDHSTRIDEAAGTAEVWTFTEGAGAHLGLKGNAASVMHCRKQDGRWLCVRHHLMLGVNDIV